MLTKPPPPAIFLQVFILLGLLAERTRLPERQLFSRSVVGGAAVDELEFCASLQVKCMLRVGSAESGTEQPGGKMEHAAVSRIEFMRDVTLKVYRCQLLCLPIDYSNEKASGLRQRSPDT